jgi:hypothetical protein
MSGAYKTLNKSDVQVIPYPANKSWTVTTSSYNSLGIRIFTGQNLTGSFYNNRVLTTDSASNETQWRKLVYEVAHQLYYKNYSTGSYLNRTSSYDNFEQTTLAVGIQQIQNNSFSASYNGPIKYFPTGAGDIIRVLSIPQQIFSNKVLPGSIVISGSDYRIIDDQEGNLFDSGSNGVVNVGNIIYPHGLLIITNPTYSLIFPTSSTDSLTVVNPQKSGSFTLNFKNEHIIYEHHVVCHSTEDEFNYTLNPSILGSSSGSINDFATGSTFNPYVTTVGLYNQAGDLLALGKMAKPIFIPRNTDLTFIIRYDT